MAYVPNRIANEFIALAGVEDRCLTNMQLQKLVFLAHGVSMAANDRVLASQNAHAFDWGPVFPKLYKALAKYGSQEVTEKLPLPEGEEFPLEELDKEVIDAVWGAYGHLPAAQRAALTHKPGSPWTQIYAADKYGVIPNDLIADYYRKMLNAGNKAKETAA